MKEKLNVIVVDSEAHFRKAVQQQLHGMADAELVGESSNPTAAAELIRQTNADLVILELPKKDSNVFNLVRRWRSQFPHLQVIACSASKNPDLILAAMRAGFCEYINKPLVVEEFRAALERAVSAHRSESQPGSSKGSIIAVFSKKGGVGATMIAANLAAALASGEDDHTVIVDLGLDFSDVANLLDIQPEFTIADLLDKNGHVEPGKLQTCLSRHASGLYFFGERERTDEAASASPEHIRELLTHLRDSFRFIVLDLPHLFDTHTYEALEVADILLLVAEGDLSTIRATKHALKVFRSLGYNERKVRIVLNRVSKRDPISISRFEETVGHSVGWTIPNDYTNVVESINSGEPIVVAKKKSAVSKRLREIADALRSPADHERSGADSKRSLMGRMFGK